MTLVSGIVVFVLIWWTVLFAVLPIGINPAPDLNVFNPATHKHLFHFPTIATPFAYDGSWSKTGPWRVDAFPFFNGRAMYVLYCSSPNYIPAHRLRRLRQSEYQNWKHPFVP